MYLQKKVKNMHEHFVQWKKNRLNYPINYHKHIVCRKIEIFSLQN